jgi:hypothetical protein
MTTLRRRDDVEEKLTMTSGHKYRPPTPREVAEDEWNVDHARGRRYCPVHPTQQMMPVLFGRDVCPLAHGDAEATASDEVSTLNR